MAEENVAPEVKQTDAEPPEVPAERKALVEELCRNVRDAKEHWSSTFKRMRNDQKFARGKQYVGSDGSTGTGQEYVANVMLRHINNRVAATYARNPRVVAKRRPRLDFKIWDGKAESLAQARQTMQVAAMAVASQQVGQVAGPEGEAELNRMQAPQPMPPPEQIAAAQALLQDVQEGQARRKMIERVGKTLETIVHYAMTEQTPNFKAQAKQLVRRVLTCKVGYIQLGYQREMGRTPEIEAKIKDASDKIAALERILSEVQSGDTQEQEADVERAKILLQQLSQAKEIVLREGLIFDFPKAWQIIPDPECTQLKGFIGAGWVAREFVYTPAKVKEIWKVDVGKEYSPYDPQGTRPDKRRKNTASMCCVWVYYDLMQRVMYTLCDGYPNFLEEPGEPPVKLEQFHNIFTLSFNDVEDDEDIYPPSDVELLDSMQCEYNRSRESWRQHRIASRPAWVSARGAFTEQDKDLLETHDAHENIELNLKSGQKIADVLMAKPTQEIDPKLYDNEPLFVDILRVSGDQEANIGGTSGATATESTIAENTRVSSIQSNIDEIDEMLTSLMRCAGQVLLMNMEPATAAKIAGPGAIWPQLSRKEIAEEIQLEIKAGSSGRPNQALKVAKLEKLAPHVMQSPGLNPTWFTKQLVQEMDDTIELEEAILEGMPSIVALNQMARPATGSPQSDPQQQGGKGGNNAEKPDGASQGASFPAGPRPQQVAGQTPSGAQQPV